LYIMQSENVLDCWAHKLVILFDRQCESILKNLGLYQVAQMKYCNTYYKIITALMEH
jgi:hypothetical protein